jgi:prostamide/prostaglandin F2alpha synthase
LIGVGLEPLGLEEFVQGDFFSGDLFVDKDKKAFSKLGFKRLSFLQLFPAIFSRKTREASSRAKSLNLGGDMKGDGYQNGGCIVVGSGGSPLIFSFRQEEVSDHPDNKQILEALGIS